MGSSGDSPGNAKVRHLYSAVFRNEDVVGFDVPVNDLVAMGMVESIGNLTDDIDSPGRFQRRLPINQVLESLSLHIFHNDKINILILANIIDIDNVGMR